jgi:hypothetical protein
MSMPQHLRSGLVACVLLCAALSSVALTLGHSRGVALIGRPLDVGIAVTLDKPGQGADLCPDADVFQGDTRVDASRVTTSLEPGSGQNAVVRVRSSQPVDEPVVTVYLRLGCKEKFTRRYVLLSEEPGDFVAPVAAAAPAVRPAPVAPPAPPAAAAAVARPAERARRSAARAVTSRAAAVSKLEGRLAQVQPKPQPASRAASRRSRSRLSVDMLDLTPVRDPQLRVTADLVSAPSASPEVRAQAAALWRSINAQPQDVLRDLRRVQALETDVKGLRTLVADNERTLNELRGQLDQARQERSLSLAAIALLALLLAAVVVTWWLRRGEATGAREWWRRRDAAAGAADIDIGIGSPRRPTAPAAPAGRPVPMDLRVDESMFESLKASSRVQQAAAVPVAVAVVAPSPALPAAKAPAQTAVPIPAEPQADKRSGPPSFHSSFQSSQVASMRMVKAEELVDIQQQADFFMSLGQTEQAIEVLASHINHNAETSALVWLDLLAIYRALKRRDDYEALRADFQRVFNAEVPGYDVTPTLSGGLEDYPRALSRIAALWPSPKVMDVIEESIFRKPGVAGSEPFDLEAYRELVMLYNLGREVVEPEAAAVQDGPVSEPVKSGFSETSMQPLSVARKGAAASRHAVDLDTGHPGETNLDDILSQRFGLDSVPEEESPETRMDDYRDPQVPRPSPRLGLDIDLSAPPEQDRQPATDSHSIDFELSEPGDGASGGKHDKP